MGQHGTSIKWKTFSILPKKYPAAPKYPALSIPLNAQLGEILWLWDMGQHGTTIKWKTFSILSCPKTPSCPRIPSSVDTTKHPLWSLFVDIPWLRDMTTWDHYKMENFLQLAPKYATVPKYQFLSIPQNTKLGIFLSTSLGFWDMGQHGTTIKWKTISIPPKKYPAAPNYPAPSIPVFLSTSLGFWDMGQHGTNGKLPENKFWSLCQHPLALGRPGLKKNVVSLEQWWWEDVGRLWHYKMETPNPHKILPRKASNLYKMETPNPSRNHSFLDVVKLRLYTGGWGFPFYSKKLAIFFILRLGSTVRWALPF